MFKHILIPTDGSPASVRAGKAAVELAGAVGARVTVFFAAPAATPLVYEGLFPRYLPPDEHAAVIERAAAKYLGAIADAAKSAGVRCETVHVTNEYPADAIVELAKRRKCDLIVMASHGRHGLSAALLGSETQKVLANAKIPVLVFR
jgi:nucleotide-binding universal stress UspA family protein